MPKAAPVITWLPTLTMFLVTTISYIDRNTLALLAPTILNETRITNEQYGFIISGFSIAYMLANPLWGRIVDRADVRLTMAIAVSAWSLASLAHAFASGVRGFLAARIALGLSESATFPGGVRTTTLTLPPNVRRRGVGIVFRGNALGSFLTPILITPRGILAIL